MPSENNGQPSLRDNLADLMNHVATEVAIAVLILLSVALILVEAAMAHTWRFYDAVVLLNDLITGLFIVELLIRFLVERRKLRFVRRFWIDIIAVLPLARGFRVLRVLRLLRLFRVGLILSRRFRFISHRLAFVRLEYVIISSAVLVAVLMGGLSIRFAEGAANPSFATFERALWFSVMTLIGGEPIGGEPESALGKLITVSLMMGGLTVFAILTGTVSAVMVDSLRNIRFRHMEIDELANHVVICGWNAAAPLIIEELIHDSEHEHFVLVAEKSDVEEHELFRKFEHRVYFHRGDYTRVDVLNHAGIVHADVAIILADDTREERSFQDRDARTVLAAMLIEKLNNEIYTTVQLLNRDNETSLRAAGVEEIIVSDEYVGNVMASVVRNRGISSVVDELLTARRGHQFFKCPLPAPLAGKTVSEAMMKLKSDHNATLIAVSRGNGASDVVVNPPADLVLDADVQIIIASDKPLKAK